MEAVRRLRDVIILTLFVLSIFALVGLQIYQGTLLNKCVHIPDWMLNNQSDGFAPATDENLLATDDGYAHLRVSDRHHHRQDHDDTRNDLIRASVYQHVYDYRLPMNDYNFSESDFSATATSTTTMSRLSSAFDPGEEEKDEEGDYPKTLVNSTDIHLLPSPKAGQSNFFQRLFHKISKPYETGNSSQLAGHLSFLEHINNKSNWIFLPNGTPKICGNGTGMGSCPLNYWCLPAGENPNFGYTNFDNFGFALLCAFRLMTQDCWEVLYQMVLTANGPYHIVFFIIVIFMGSFYLVNLILAIVAMSYDDCQKQELLEEEEDEDDDDDGDDDDDNDDGGDGDDELMMMRREMVLGYGDDPGIEAQSIKEKKEENPYQSVEDNYCLPLKMPERRHLVESPPSSIKTEYALKSEGSNLSGVQEDRGPGKVLSESCGQLEKRKNDSIVIEISDCSLRFVDDDDAATNLDNKSISKCMESLRHQNSSSSSPPNHRHRRIMQDLNPQYLSHNHKYQQSFTTAREIQVHGRPLRISRTFGDTPKSSSLTMDQFSAKRGRTPSVHLQPPAYSQHRHSSWDGLPVIYHHHHPAGSQKRLVEKVKAAHRASLRRQSLRLRRASVEACLHKTLSSLSFQQNVEGISPHKSVFEPTHFLWMGTKLQMDTRGSKKLEICPTLVQANERRKECEVETGDDGCRTSDLPDDDGRPSIEYNDLRLLQSFLHDTKKGIPNKPQNLKKYLEEKCYHLLFGWQCCPAWQRFASWVELFIMDAFVDLFITLCIVINTVFMALDHEGMSYQLGQVLSIGNYVFTAIFTFEAALKIMALGLQQYLRDRWSCFDLVIVALSLVELGLANVKGLSILRSFRLLRVFKLAKSWPTLNLLIGIIGRTMGALGNLCFVLAIIIFIFAVMGMQLFGEDYTAEIFGEVPRWNFCNFLHSFMIVFRVLCGEWIESMWNCIHCSGVVCIPFFLLTMIIGNLVVLNLFLALLLSSFGAESLQGGSNQDDGEANKLQEAVDRLTRFCRFIKSHVLVCIYHRMKRGGQRKYVPVYRKIDLDGKIWFEDTTEEDFEDRITNPDLSRKNGSSEDANIPMIKIVRDSCNGTSSQQLTGAEHELKTDEELKSDFVAGTNQQFNNNSNIIGEELDKKSSRKSYKQLRQHSLSTSSGCNISTPSCADREEETTGRSESPADLGGPRMSHHRPDNKISLLSDSTPSSNFKGYETEATVETSGNDLTDDLSSSEEALIAGNIVGRNAKVIEDNKINNDENNIRNSSSSAMSLSSDGALVFDSKNKALTQQQQQKQLLFQQYLLNLEATEVEIEYITYPDDCCPLCLTRRCCCCCPKWWQTTTSRVDSSRIGTAFWKARTSCYAMVEHKIFETFIIVMIICSSLTLAAEDKNIHENPPLKRILKLLDKSFSIIFVLEMVVKLMAYGFKKYFTDAWCWLDFVIVAISMVSLAAEGVGMGNIGAFRALRTLRALRPLRAVSRWEGMKVVVNALIQAIPAICNVLLVCLVFWLIFSIMGVNLFGGRFGRCVDGSGRVMNASLVANKTQCLDLGGWDSTDVESLKMDADLYNLTWLTPKINFDHVPIAYLALFQIATFKGWTDIMNYAIDSKEPGLQPESEIRVYMYLYFVFFIVFGSFFTLNLFIGVIIDNFNMQKKKSGSQQLFMTEDQKKYYNAMKKLGSKQPQKPVPKPHFRCSLLLFHLVSNQKFDVAIMIAILINMFTMAVEHYEQSSELSYILTKVNQVFIAVFTVECLMKLVALRHYYFKQPWNVFDFIVVVLSILAPATNEIIEKYFVSPTLLRVVRVFRVGRILRLVKSAKGIRTLLFSLAVSLPALVNIGLLLFLIMFIYAIFGMSFFMHVKHNAGIEELFNFETFFKSMTLLFQISTSAGWDSVLAGLMIEPPYCDPLSSRYKGLTTQPKGAANESWINRTFELSTIPQNWIHATLNINPNDFSDDDDHPNGDCGHTGLAVLYLVSYLVVSYLVVINMYIAVILENFSQATDDIRQGLTQDDFDMYYEVWEKFDEKATQFIPLDMMGQFVDALEHPLRLPLPNKCKLVSLNIPICENDRVHCLDILDALTKNFLGTSGDMGGELAKLKASIGYKPVTTTLLRRREVYCATVIQRAWRAHKKRSK